MEMCAAFSVFMKKSVVAWQVPFHLQMPKDFPGVQIQGGKAVLSRKQIKVRQPGNSVQVMCRQWYIPIRLYVPKILSMISYFFFFLNISSILSVTAKPPTTFSVPNIRASNPVQGNENEERSAWPTRIIPPMIITPLIAFAPDISGVCKTAGTLEITSIPRKMDKAMMKISNPCIQKNT
jgi:hypothetical protein